WAVIFTGRTSEGEIYISAAEKILPAVEEVTDPALLEQTGHLAAVRQYLAALKQDVAGIIRYANLALKYLPEKDLSIRGIVTFLLGSGRLLASQFDLAEVAFVETVRLGKAAGNTLITVNALCALANLIRTRGELHRAYQMYQEAAGLAVNERGVSLPVCAEVLVGRARLFYEWNNLKAAEEDLLTARKYLRLYANFDLDVDCNLILSRLRFVQGNLAAAEEFLREGVQGDRQVSLRPGVALLASHINFYQAKGDLARVTQLVDQQDWSLENKPLYAWADAFLAYGDFLCRQKRYGDAQRLLAQCLERLQGLDLGSLVIKTLILQAIVFDSQGQHALALQAIARALPLGEVEGFIRIFVDEGEAVRRLLVDCRTEISRNTTEDSPARHRLMIYLDVLLSAFPEPAPEEIRKTSTKNLDQDELIEALTARELEVIRLIADGLSNKEIAERLVVSIGTVKAHTTNIYRKLDVPGRTKALAKAREFHIL
ncbi:tetratricopeptide repeat protein, partial [bacterium]